MLLPHLFSEPIVLQNNQVVLTPFSEEHAEGFAKIAFDPEIWRWTSPHINTKEDLDKYVVQLKTYREKQEKYPFTIIEKSSNRIAGVTTYMGISPEHQRLEIGSTWLGAAFHGSGINKACKFLLLQYAFEHLLCIRVELKTDFNNLQSRKAIAKLGAKEEGVLRQHMIMPGGRVRDTVYFSILKEEWPKIKQNIFIEW
jgi:RimJ/RimL family protein N-acetyltransferase